MKRLIDMPTNRRRYAVNARDARRLYGRIFHRSFKTARRCGMTFHRLTAILVLCLVFGCTTFDLSKRIPWLDTDAVVKQPTKITALWTVTVLNSPGQKGVRGFGGRIMFHGKEQEKPVKVSGTLTVFAFDVTSRVSSVPDRKFVFTEEQFDNHYSMSKLGHSYSIWLPWDEVGGELRKISLMGRFEPSEGSGMIMSEDSLQTLPGISSETSVESYAEQHRDGSSSMIQQAGYQQESAPPQGHQALRRTSLTDTDPIDLPPSFSRRLSQPPDPSMSIPMRSKSASRPTGYPADQSRSENGINGSDNPKSASQDSDSTANSSPYESLMVRKKELSDRFGRRKYQAQTTSSVRSNPAVLQNRLPPSNKPSLPRPESSLEPMDPFESDDLPVPASLR